MQNFTSEYRAWMIQEINSTLAHPMVDTDQMTTSYIEKLHDNVQIRNQNQARWNQLRAMCLDRRPGSRSYAGSTTDCRAAQKLERLTNKIIYIMDNIYVNKLNN